MINELHIRLRDLLARRLRASQVTSAALRIELGKSGECRHVDKLTRNVMNWIAEREEDRTRPNLDQLIDLCNYLGLSIDELVGFAPRCVESNSAELSVQTWLREFLLQAMNLSCYVVFVQNKQIAEWREIAGAVTRSQADRLFLIESWATQVPVFDMSAKLRSECGFNPMTSLCGKHPHGRLHREYTMQTMMQKRLDWIGKVPKIGQELRHRAEIETCERLYESIMGGVENGKITRYPCMYGSELRSLQVSHDTIPGLENQIGWIIYYYWGSEVSSEQTANLLC